MRLILVRHGQTDWNEQRRVQGLSDTGLNERGKRQAQAVARALNSQRISALYSSPLKRALETAHNISLQHQVPVVTDERLRELDVGELDGLTYEEMRERYGPFLKEWYQDAASARFPGGERLQDLQEKVWASLREIRARHPQGEVVVVSHSFALQSALCKALGLPLSHFRRFSIEVGSINILDFKEEKASLVLLNDTCHLEV